MALIVKAHTPWKTRLLLVLSLITLCLAGWALFEYGRYSAGFDGLEARDERNVLLKQIDELEDQIADLRKEKAGLERAQQIERKAYDDLDTSLKVLQSEILELKEEVAFYRGIISPRDAAQGLYLQTFKVEPNGSPRGFRYKVILTQVFQNEHHARGVIRLSIEGLFSQQPKVLPLAEVTEKHIKELEYRFKYFQNMEGDLQLPPGFKPKRVIVSVLPAGRGPEEGTIEKTYDWPG
ncbi:MAG: hypothetical protein HY080_02410 [Gammaproteobacteria bacterium]|nr:hypothetical protein [Gammaproteobacteria bacterium]